MPPCSRALRPSRPSRAPGGVAGDARRGEGKSRAATRRPRWGFVGGREVWAPAEGREGERGAGWGCRLWLWRWGPPSGASC